MRRLARDQGARVVFVYCECPPAVARERLGIRLTDPEAISDGRVELFEDQARDFDPFTPEDRPLAPAGYHPGPGGGAGRTAKLCPDLFIGRPAAAVNRLNVHSRKIAIANENIL